MGFRLFMLMADLLIPFIMIFLGRRFSKKPPEKISILFGYRTARSMKNRATWEFAHHYFGKLWFTWGLILLPLSVLPLLFVWNRDADTVETVGCVVCLVQLIPLVGAIVPTEAALRRTFNEKGKRR